MSSAIVAERVAGDPQNLRRLSEGAGRAGSESKDANQDLALGVVDLADREGGAVFFRGEADRDCRAGCDRSSRKRVARASDRPRENTPKLWRISLNSLLPCSRTRQIVGSQHKIAFRAAVASTQRSSRAADQAHSNHRREYIKKMGMKGMRNRRPSPTPKTPAKIAGATPRQA